MRLSLTLSLALLVAVSSLATPSAQAARFVIVGVADVDASATTLSAIDLDTGAAADVGVLHHGAGETPNGVLVDDRRLAVVSPRDGELRLYDLLTRDERSLTSGLLRNQRPLVTTTKKTGTALVAIRPVESKGDTHFNVVAVHLDHNDNDNDSDNDGVEVLASAGPRTWVMPVASSSSRVSVVAVDAASDVARVFDVVDRRLRARAVLGGGVFRGAAWRSDGRLLVEREHHDDDGRARLLLVSADGKKVDDVLDAAVLPGLSPVVAGTRSAASTGKKDGSVVVDSDGRGFVAWPGARVGVARPQALTADGEVVVVVSIDRGQSLPKELWALTKAGGHRLVEPAARRIVTVYGISAGIGADIGAADKAAR